jgi:acetylglutamate/LysW-gamma-L-alpha-aminoadipate kinase
VVIVKVGGGKGLNLEGLAEDVARLDEEVLIVHGANAWRDALAQRLGVRLEVLTSASGYASVLSDEPLMELMLMAYAGLRNKRLVEALMRRGVRAVGLTGLDGAVIRGRRNAAIRAHEGERIVLKRDLSGKPREVNAALLRLLLGAGYTPVLTVPIADENGFAVNSENDEVVALLQETFRARCVVHLIEAAGILADRSDPASAMTSLSKDELARLEAEAPGRFRRKLRAILRTLEAGPVWVAIADGRAPHPLEGALSGKGTVIQ